MLDRTLLITGTVGAGKTTVGTEVALQLSQTGRPAGFIDLDALSRLWPPPPGDPFRVRLALANLSSMVGNFETAGARTLVLARAIQSQDDVAAIERAVGAPVGIVRLVAPRPVIEDRLRKRHVGPAAVELAWHLERAPQLDAILDRSDLRGPSVSNTGTVPETAAAVISTLEPTTRRS